MISTYFTMNSAMSALNNAQYSAVQNSNMLQNQVSFGISQPLEPVSFGKDADVFELQNKSNETKISVLQKLIDAIKQKLGKDIKKSTPKYAGVDYKA